MNIIIIGQYFPPYQTPRSFRIFELARELAKQHDVTVYALLGGFDYSEMQSKYNFRVKTLGRSRCGNLDSTGKKRFSIVNSAIARLFGRYLYFPMCELSGMVCRIVMDNYSAADAIISVAYPHSVHWGVMKAKQKVTSRGGKFPVWISDCGDPFMGNPFGRPPFYFEKVERKWSEMTDYITVPTEIAIKGYYPEYRTKICVIPQGFDFSGSTDAPECEKHDMLTFVFAGNVTPKLRDPDRFIRYISEKREPFKFVVYSQSNAIFSQYSSLLGSRMELHPFIERKELLKVLKSADFLLNIANAGSVQTPSKLIDYALSGRPILQVSSEFEEKDVVDEFFEGDYSHALPKVDISLYDIRNVAGRFVSLIEGKIAAADR